MIVLTIAGATDRFGLKYLMKKKKLFTRKQSDRIRRG